MARLPDAPDLGGLPNVASRRPIASYDVGAIARAGEHIGEAIARGGEMVGNAMSDAANIQERATLGEAQGLHALGTGTEHLVTGVHHYIRAVDDYELSSAKADKLTQAAQLDTQFQNDKDYGSYATRYSKGLADINKNVAANLSPFNQERYRIWAEPRDAHAVGSAQGTARSIERDVGLARDTDNITKLQEKGLSDPDPLKGVDTIDTVNGLLKSQYDRGWITAQQWQNQRQNFAQNFAVKRVGMMPDGEQIALLSGPPQEGSVATFIPADARAQMVNLAKARIDRQVNEDSARRSEEVERSLLDAKAGIGEMPPRSVIEQDPTLTEPRRNNLLRQWDSAMGDVQALQRVVAKFNDPNGAPFNPYDKEDVDGVDKIFRVKGSDSAALQAVLDRTGMVPKTAATALRGDLNSQDPKRVAGALKMTTSIIAQNPNAFVSEGGKKEFDDASVMFLHRTQEMGMTADEAARKQIESQTPEYAQRQARIKGEDLNDIVKKQVSLADVRGAFNKSWLPNWIGAPKLGFDRDTEQSMYNDYVEAFRDAYLKSAGDVGDAKARAAAIMTKTWGISKVNGSDVIMRYPPDQAPAYAGIDNIADKIANDAVAAIKSETGQTVDRSKLVLSPLPGGRTSTPFWRGEAPPYQLYWFDDKGVLQSLNPGRAFVTFPNDIRQQQTQARQSQFEEAARARAEQRAAPSPLLEEAGAARTGFALPPITTGSALPKASQKTSPRAPAYTGASIPD